jgi:CHAT domain-containing protein
MLPTFYRLLARGQPAIHALRQAQLEALGNSEAELSDPATWSVLAVVDTI